jgi:DNA-binding MarR family transcriptional regulator
MMLRDTLPFRTLMTLAGQRGGIEQDRCRVMLEWISTAAWVRAALREELGSLGITELDLGVLVSLFTVDPQPFTLATLASHTGATRPGITEVVDRLEARGLVRRERDTRDRRLIYAHLTDSGREETQRAFSRFLEKVDALAQHLSAESRRFLPAACAELNVAARAAASHP